jgi:hypothetical protein
MPKSRRKRRASQRNAVAPITKQEKFTSADAALHLAPLALSCVIGTGAAIISTFHVIARFKGREMDLPRWAIDLTFFCGMTGCVIVLREIRNNHPIVKDGKFYVEGMRRTRRQGVFLLSMSFFLLLISSIQAMSAFGYLGPTLQWVQTRVPLSWIGKNSWVAFSFLASALLSNILGNFAYDGLKFVAKKLRLRHGR